MNCAVLALVLLVVQPQPTDTVGSVRFRGNHHFSNRVLARVVSSRAGEPLDVRRLDRDARMVKKLYRDNGFRDVEVTSGLSGERRRVVVNFHIREGVRTRLATVAIAGNVKVGTGRLYDLLPVQVSSPVEPDLVSRSESAVRDYYQDNGYAFAKVAGRLEFQDSLALLSIDIEEGPLCRVGAVRIRGNTSVSVGPLLRALELKPGEVYRQDQLRGAQRRLYATRLFRRVLYQVLARDTTSNADEEESVVVRFDVVEQSYRVFALGVGAEYPPIRLLLTTGWEHYNLFNQAHEFRVGAEYAPSFVGDYRVSAEASYRLPYVLWNRLDLKARPFVYWETVDTTLRREIGIETGLTRLLRPELSAAISNRLRLVADTSTGITNAVALALQYDTRNDIFDPIAGMFLGAAAEVAGGPLGGDNDLYRVVGETRGFWSAAFGFVLAGRLKAGRVFGYGRTRTVPYYESFSLGGRSSLRGYEDKSIGPDSALGDRYGPIVVNANLEIRSPYVLSWVGLVGFVDAGDVVAPEPGLTTEGIALGAGMGIRLRTPIGPLRLDWGRRIREPLPGDRGRLYFGILHAF